MKFEPHIAKRQALKIRLAADSQEVQIAQRLRYLVFHKEMGASLSAENQMAMLERDHYDDVCDHLLVIDANSKANPELLVEDGQVVGTYRLLRQSVAARSGGFYSQTEFDINPLLARNSELKFLELGRSCVLSDYRGSSVVELLWQGIWNYVRHYHLDVMFGCASFEGIDVRKHNDAINAVLQLAKAPREWHVEPLQSKHQVFVPLKPPLNFNKSVITNLPPLIKGYLRLGSYFSNGVAVDHIFKTTDMLVILPVTKINPRYFARFGEPTN